jgi:hypothetical protein
MPAPDAETIDKLKSHLMGVWQKAHTQWKIIDSYYNRTFTLWKPGVTRPSYRPSTARRIIDSAVDTQLAFSPSVSKPPAGEGDEHKRMADESEEAMKAIIDESSLLEPSLTWKQVGKNMALYGYAVVDGPSLNFVDKPQRPERERHETGREFELREALYTANRATWVPVRIRGTHPARILLDPLEKRPKFAIKSVSRFSQDLHELTVKKREAGTADVVKIWEVGDDPFAQIETIEHWTMDWHTVIAKEKGILYREKNAWGFIPVSHAYAGFGQEPTELRQIDPSYLAVGLLDHLIDDIWIQAQQESGKHNALMEATFNTRATSGDAAEVADHLARGSDPRPGEPGDLWWNDVPNLPNWLFEAGKWIDQDIEMGSFSKIVSGHKEVGVSTVGQQAILSTAANRKFAAMLTQMNHLASVTGSWILRLLDILDEPLTIKGHTIGPKQIDHSYAIDLKFQVVDPVLALQEKEMAMREVQVGLSSEETYWSVTGKEDATGEARRLLLESIRKNPRVQALMASKVAEEVGLADLISELEAEAGLGAGGGGGGGGVGGGGGGGGVGNLRQPLTPDVAKPPQVSVPAGGI